ncbi:hypothetical protein [Hugenholtzia roseola]|nr:hypothetical protein [Hugenholtzia roseola]
MDDLWETLVEVLASFLPLRLWLILLLLILAGIGSFIFLTV